MLTSEGADLNSVTIATHYGKCSVMLRRARSVFAGLALSALASAAANASFTPLGVVDGLKVNGSSADGSYIVGQYLDVNDDKIAMRWDITGSDPLEDLGELPTGKIESNAHAASADGSVVVGESKIRTTPPKT